MSLKAFHIVFVTCAVLLAFFFGGWLVHEYRSSGQPGQLFGGIGSFLAGVGMIWYGRRVLRKLKHIGYL
jgi:DNA-binding transcriptional regulator of glucitol operon